MYGRRKKTKNQFCFWMFSEKSVRFEEVPKMAFLAGVYVQFSVNGLGVNL